MKVEKSLWKKRIRKNASAKGLGPRDRVERGIYAKERESIFVIEREERGSTSICGGSIAKRVHPSLKITANVTSTLCGKKGW